MNDIKVFENCRFGSIRVVERSGEPWFVAKDVCECLGIANSRDAVSRLDDDEKGVGKTDTLVGAQDVTLISESGLYTLIMRSNKPEAKEFRKWVTSDVLPSIRKNGVYATDNFIQKSIEDPDWAISMLQQLKFEREQKQLALQQRDEAIRTKAQIGARREATAMNTASQKSKECERLRERIGNSLQWRQAKAVTWAKEYFSIKMRGFWSAFGKFLSKISRQMNVEIRKIKCDDAGDCQKFDSVNEYHISVINNAKMLLDGGGLFDDYIDAKILALIVTYRK